MNICYGPADYLRAFTFVLAGGLLCGFGLGWHFREHFRDHPPRACC